MDANGNQRKRAVRIPKNASISEKSQSKNNVQNENIGESAVAISPTLEECEIANNAPECRRSSRKKIIKFDVRDLLNKNRKTHKIQIEARIDSNAPTTSKTATASGIEIENARASTTTREDLLSKQKTFLEKSAIFRRYSISQEHKPPPPPLPIPPLLGKTNDNKDTGLSSTSSSRRLSRTQEFYSNVMNKPKQTTSLIVAQFESNTPCSAAVAKRKNLFHDIGMVTKNRTSSETEYLPIVQQKKRGRPAKNKSLTSVETPVTTSVKEESTKKKITPEKAKNWKEYKACLAQQSSITNEEKEPCKTVSRSEHQKDEEVITFDDTLQSDISRSDDDGNFSGFQTSKYDVSCDSPALPKISFEKGNNTKEIFNDPQSSEKSVVNIGDKAITKAAENKSTTVLNEKKTTQLKKAQATDSKQGKTEELCLTKTLNITSEEKLAQNIYKKEINLESLKTVEMLTKDAAEIEQETEPPIKISEQEQYRTLNVEETELSAFETAEKIAFKRSNNPTNVAQNKEIYIKSDVNTTSQPKVIEEKCVYYKPKAAEWQDVQKAYSTDHIETETLVNTPPEQLLRNKTEELGKDENLKTEISSHIYQKGLQEIEPTLESEKQYEGTKQYEGCTTIKPPINENVKESGRELKSPDILSKSTLYLEESTINPKLAINDVMLLTNQMSPTQASTSSEGTKLFSRTSSSSDSENASERSSYSSETFSTTSSSSPRSYKSGDKLRVSVKRISLPKSPSTSSQTSTSEELNDSEVLKRKPPMAKRSKRLQKKYEKISKKKNVTENIDNSFQRNLSDDNKKEPNLDEQASLDNITLPVKETIVEMCIIKVVKSTELVEKDTTQPIEQETVQDSSESNIALEITDSRSNQSLNMGYLSDKERNVKRKSLRNQKEHDYYNKDGETDKQKSKSKEQSLGIEDISKHTLHSNEYEINFDYPQENTTTVENNLELYNENDDPADNKETKKSRKFQSVKQVDEKSLLTEDKTEILKCSEETTVEKDNITTDEVEKAENKENKNIKLTNEEKLSKRNETITDLNPIETYESTNEGIKTNDNTSTKEIDIYMELHTDVKAQETSAFTQRTHRHNAGQNVGSISKEMEVETLENTRDIINSPVGKSIKNDQERIDIMTSTRAKTNKDEKRTELETTQSYLKDMNESMQVEILDMAPYNIKSHTQTIETASTTTKSNNEEISAADFMFRNKQLVEDVVKKTIFRENSTQPSKTESGQKGNSSSEIMPVESAESAEVKTKMDNKLNIVYEEARGDRLEKENKNTSTKRKIIKEDVFIEKTEMQNKNLKFEEKFARLKEVSPKHKSELHIPEMLDVEFVDSTHGKTKTPSEQSAAIDEHIAAKKSEKAMKNASTKSRSNKAEISTKETSVVVEYPTHSSTQDELSTKSELKLVETYVTTERSKENLFTIDNDLSATKDSSSRSRTNKKENSTNESKILEDNPTHKFDKASLKEKETESFVLKRRTFKKANSPKLSASSSENPEKSNRELSSSNSLMDSNLAEENLPTDQSVSAKIFQNISSSTKTLPFKNAESLQPSLDTNLADEFQELDNVNNTVEFITEASTTNTQQENTLHNNKPQILPTKRAVAKLRDRKSRFKNLYGPGIDSKIDSSNEKNTPDNEMTYQQHKIDAKSTRKEQAEEKEIQKPPKLPETGSNICETENKLEEDPVSIQENSKSNLLSSQIKNVSIETNTLLDILRTVQSNTEAALKAGKSPINIDVMDSEKAIEITTKMQFEECQDIQSDSKTGSPAPLITNSPLTVKKQNLSPPRSDSDSPLTLKKITSPPTRSNSSSPLTLKKVTRRYERRSRRGEDSTHKTLEETFAEIAAQSSKAVLADKELGIDEHQTTDNKSEKELEVINAEPTVEKEQIKDNFAQFDKSTDLAEMPFNVDTKVDENLLNVSPDIVVSKEKEIATQNIFEADTTKIPPAKRGRKPKNRSLEIPTTVAKEMLEEKKFPKTIVESTITKEIVKETKIESETVEKAKEERNTGTQIEPETGGKSKDEKNHETQIIKSKVIESLETTQFMDKTESKSKNSLPLPNSSHADLKKNTSSSQIATDACLKPFEDAYESKSDKKSNQKLDTKVLIEENSSISNVTCKDDIRTPKQAIKKRDPSLNKSETKSVGKKLPKKTKHEEDVLNLQKEETLTKAAATTTPPPKRGRKPKNQQPETPHLTTSSKKKNKKDGRIKNYEDVNLKEQILDFETDSLNTSLDKTLDEKLAKKKRQKKLKEAFEAALTDGFVKNKDDLQTETCSPISISSFGLTLFNNSPPPEKCTLIYNEEVNENIKLNCLTPVETEDDPDPLKDIEKFIADGVNLLKKDYKLDDDSVDDVVPTPPSKITAMLPEEEPVKNSNEESKGILNIFETPADTPLNTPSATPPPKSPISVEFTTPDENSGVRRSHRIKLITKTPKALVGRGLVRDKERLSIKDDVETKSHYTIDDHLTDLAEVEAKNAKFLKEMEERLSNFQVVKENEYLCERVISREARKMICDCFLTHEEEERGELGCGEDCLNRLLMIECGPECNVKERCTNRRFQKLLCSPCRVFRTEKKGFGIMADIEILPGEFIMEYVGEVIDTDEFEKRRIMYSQDKNRHYYFMALRSDAIIDATIKGNISRFINHSCDPNAETQKWTVNGELRIGFFSRKSIMPGEEITFNYQYQRYGREAQRCYCESANCRGWIGQEPTSDEGEQIDDENDESEDDEEDADTSNLLVQDDDEDSDASVADPEEVQKQLEMAAAQAEVELAPLQLLEDKAKQVEIATNEGKLIQDLNKSDNEEDSKSKFKKLLSKMAEKVAAKQKQNKREQKLQRKKKSKKSTSELTNKLRFLEDPDIEDEVEFLKECGLKNQSDTLRLSRLMVRAKLVQTRLNLLEILRKGDFPCRRLFLDYHGLRLLHGWMSEDAGNLEIRLSLLQTLESLPIANKTVLTDSKVMQVVRNWCGSNTNLSPNEDSSSSSQDTSVLGTTCFEEGSEMSELQKLALKLIITWDGLPEIFRIPKKERIEQMKEHEREADRQYAANAETQENTTATDRYRRDRFSRGLNTPNSVPNPSNRFVKPNNGNPHRTANTTSENIKNLSKAQRREMFAAKVARDEAEKRLAEERREFETKCRFFGLDPKKTRLQDIPFCVNPATGQWFSIERKPIATPPSYAHVQVPFKPKSTDPNDYQLPAACSSLPPQWKYAITTQGKIYYYHIKHRIPQWEPPSAAQLKQCEEAREEDSESELTTTAGEDSSDDDDDILIGMNAAQLKTYIDRKVEIRRQQRYQRLVEERCISPRREEDRIYNQIEARKYKENKEKIRKRKEDIRRKRAEILRQTSINMCTLGSIIDVNTNKLNTESDEESGALPIQDYLLSSDEEIDIKAEVNSPLIDKIVEGDKIVDELDALTTKKQLKRPLPPHRDLNEPSTSSVSAQSSIPATIITKQEYKKRKLEKKEKRKPKEQDAKYRKNKEKFRCEIAGIIVHHLKPYRKDTCTLGRIQSNEDFNHLARKLTHFVMIKELKYCESVGQTLVVTESVKSKSREFIKKYMAKYGDVYVKPTKDPDFKDIPFTL